MSLLGWFRKGGAEGDGDPRLLSWRKSWNAAAEAADTSALAALVSELNALGLSEEDIEIEREMLEALQDLSTLTTAVRADGLPVIVTGHRVVANERCHFTAPASMPDEPSQPGGRLLLTSRRAVFIGGAAARSVPWHAVAAVIQLERDLVLMRRDGDGLHRFRCNTFSEALRSAFLARELRRGRERPQASL
jgi:hypothetical protein